MTNQEFQYIKHKQRQRAGFGVWRGFSKRKSKSPRVFARQVKNGLLKYDSNTGIYVST